MEETYLAHHGIKGQKWGIRRFQNEDGSLTEKGQKRYASTESSLARNQRDTRVARAVAKSTAEDASNYATRYRSTAQVLRAKQQKMAEKGNTKREARIKKRAESAEAKAKAEAAIAKTASLTLKQIDSGKLQAGKDYIVTTHLFGPNATVIYSKSGQKKVGSKSLTGFTSTEKERQMERQIQYATVEARRANRNTKRAQSGGRYYY